MIIIRRPKGDGLDFQLEAVDWQTTITYYPGPVPEQTIAVLMVLLTLWAISKFKINLKEIQKLVKDIPRADR